MERWLKYHLSVLLYQIRVRACWGKQKDGDATIAVRTAIAWRELSVEKVLAPALKWRMFS